MAKPFRDVKILGMLHERSYVVKPPVVCVCFKLSESPPLGWANMLATVCRNPADPMRRQVTVEADLLWLECIPKTLTQKHLDSLNEAVALTNADYRAAFRQQVVERQKQAALDSKVIAQLEALNERVYPAGNAPAAPEPELKPVGGPLTKLRRVLGLRKGRA